MTRGTQDHLKQSKHKPSKRLLQTPVSENRSMWAPGWIEHVKAGHETDGQFCCYIDMSCVNDQCFSKSLHKLLVLFTWLTWESYTMKQRNQKEWARIYNFDIYM